MSSPRITIEQIRKIKERMELAKQGPAALAMAQLLAKIEQVKGDPGEKGDTVIGPMGPRGPKGDKGDKGDKGENGRDGTNGKDGKTPKNGKDGATPRKYIDYFTYEDVREVVGLVMDRLKKDGINDKQIKKTINEAIKEAIKSVPTITKELPNISLIGGGSGARLQVFNDGSNLGQDIRKIDFIGDGVEAYRVGEGVVVSVAGGGGTGSATYRDDGTISGQTITLTRAATTILGLYINGAFIHSFTHVSGENTITISAADAAGYDGNSYSVIYV
jgi:hypothetical protein